MPRSIWNGVISFGMVSIPVKLYTATQSKDISFHLLHEECHSRLKQKRWCPFHDREVEWGEIVRGYEYARDQYVVMADEDFDKLPLPSKHMIELSAFVKSDEIDPVYYEKTYYLEPDETGVKPYALLMQILKEKGLVAVAKVAIRTKESLCALRPYNGALALETLYYPDEIRIPDEVETPKSQVSERELDMARSLVELLSESFEPEKYHDSYREALKELIEAKLQGQEIVEVPPPVVTRAPDLMEALKASLEAARKRQHVGEREREAPRRRRRAAAG